MFRALLSFRAKPRNQREAVAAIMRGGAADNLNRHSASSNGVSHQRASCSESPSGRLGASAQSRVDPSAALGMTETDMRRILPKLLIANAWGQLLS